MTWGEKARGVELSYGQLALTMALNYSWAPSAHRHAWTIVAASQGAYMMEEQCHDLFPELSPSDSPPLPLIQVYSIILS